MVKAILKFQVLPIIIKGAFFFSKAEAKSIYEINNISEVLILFMFTIYSTPEPIGDKCNHYVVLTRKLFVLLLARLPELLWKIIHGVIQLAFSATKKLI